MMNMNRSIFNLASVVTLYILSNGAHATPWGDVEASVYSYRLSSFINGNLIRNEKLPLASVPDSPATLARAGFELFWTPKNLDRWRVGVFKDNTIRANGQDGSVKALALINNRGSLSNNVDYPFNVQSVSMSRSGLLIEQSLGSLNIAPHIGVSWSVRLFGVEDYRSTVANGFIRENSNGSLGVQAEVTKTDLGRSTTFVPTTGAVGYGASFGLALEGGDPNMTSWVFSVDDISAPVNLKSVLVTRNSYNNVNVQLDGNGLPNFAGVAVGSFSNESVKATVNPRLAFEVVSDLNHAWHLRAGTTWEKPLLQGFVGVDHQVNGGKWLTSVHIGNNNLPASLGLGLNYKGLTLAWRGDKLSPSKARIWGLSGSMRF
jgi:hypothetical protein